MGADLLKIEEHNTMARYTGPKNKISRRLGGTSFRRVKQSDYYIQLLEKQKLKYIYGILEKQCRKMFYKAYKSKGVTGEVLLQLLESRLDNVVYRMGFAVSRQAARQLVSHGHIMVNDKKNNIPSYIVKPGDTISIIKYNNLIEKKMDSSVEWIGLDNMCGIFKYIPERKQIPENINEQLIVQWYSK